MSAVSSRIAAERQPRESAQDSINRLRLVGEIRGAIQEAFDAALGEFPQYASHLNGWRLGFIRSPVRTKLGLAFATGDVVLYRDQDERAIEVGCDPTFKTAYSVRNAVDTSIPNSAIEPLATSTTYRHPTGLVTLGG